MYCSYIHHTLRKMGENGRIYTEKGIMKPKTFIQIKVLQDHWIRRMKGLNGQRVYLNINESVVSSISSQYRIHNPPPFPDFQSHLVPPSNPIPSS